MEVYFFGSDAHPSVTAFASDRAGTKLPPVYPPWTLLSGTAIRIGPTSVEVVMAISGKGYFLTSGEVRHE